MQPYSAPPPLDNRRVRPIAPIWRTPILPLREVVRQHILTTLRQHRGHKTKAALALGISRSSLTYKLKRYAADDRKLQADPQTRAGGR